MSEDKKQTAALENVLGEVKKLNTNVTKSEEGKTTGLAFGSAQISDDIEKLDENLNDSVNKVGAQLKNNADAAQGSAASETEDKRDQMNIFKKLLGGISGIGKGIGGMLSSFGKGALDAAKSGFESIKGALLPLLLPALLALLNSEQWRKIGEIVEQVVEALKVFYDEVLVPIFTSLKEGFFRQFEIFGELFDGIGEAIQLFKDGEILEGIGKLITSIATFFVKTIDNLVTTTYNAIAGIFGFEQTDSVGMAIIQFFKDTYENIKTTVKETFENVKAFFTETFESVKKFFTDTFTFIGEGLSQFSVFQFIKQTVEDIIGTVKKIFSSDFTMEDLLEGGFALFDIVFGGVNLAVNFIKDIFKFGDPEDPFRLSDFLFGPDGVFTKVVGFFKRILDFDFVGAIRGIPGAESVLEFLGVLPEKEQSLEEKIADKEEQLAEQRADVADEGNYDRFVEGRLEKEADKLKLIELEKELTNLKMQQSNTLAVDPKLVEAVKTKQAAPNIIDGSTDARSFSPVSTTVVQPNITDPIAMRQGLVNG